MITISIHVSYFSRILRLIFGYRSAYQSGIMLRNIMGVKGKKKWGKPNWPRHITKGRSREEKRGETQEVLVRHPADDVSSTFIFKNSSHRNGAIYKRSFVLRKSCRVTDRDESKWCKSLSYQLIYRMFHKLFS